MNKGLRGREGASDYVELVFTRNANANTDTTAERGGGDGGGGDGEPWTPEDVGKLHKTFGVDAQCIATLDFSTSGAGDGGGGGSGGSGGGAGGGGVDAAEALVACVRTDRPDGLMTTVVCDTTGVALGLVSGAGEG